MEIIILGSSAAIPTKDRNLSSIALKIDSEILLFDCGEDVQRRLIDAGIKFNKPLKILISHFHGDHVIGLPGLLFRFSLSERTAPVVIFGPRNTFLYIYLQSKILGLKAVYPIKIIEIDHENNTLIEFDGINSEKPKSERNFNENIIYDSKKYSIRYAIMDHSILTYAYSFVEKPRFGKFNPERAKELGIPASNIYKKLQKGQIVEFNGKKIDPIKEGIVGPNKPGRKITYSSDTQPCDALVELGINSDVLIHEATFSHRLVDVAREKKHSTAVDAANDAKKMNAKQLILTHISSRYQHDASVLLEEARSIFPNTIIAKDLMNITIK